GPAQPATPKATSASPQPLAPASPQRTAAEAGSVAAAALPDLERELAEVEAGLLRRRDEEAALAERSAALRKRIAHEQERGRQVAAFAAQREEIRGQLQDVDQKVKAEETRLAQVDNELRALGPMPQPGDDEVQSSRLLRYIQIGIWWSAQNQAASAPAISAAPTGQPASQLQNDEDKDDASDEGYPPPTAPAANTPPPGDDLPPGLRPSPPSQLGAEDDGALPRTLTTSPSATHSDEGGDAFTSHSTQPSMHDERGWRGYPAESAAILLAAPPAQTTHMPSDDQVRGLKRLLRWSIGSSIVAASIGALALTALVFIIPAIVGGSQPSNQVRRMDAAPTTTAQARVVGPNPTTSSATATPPDPGVIAAATGDLATIPPAATPTVVPPTPTTLSPATTTSVPADTTSPLPATPIAATPPTGSNAPAPGATAQASAATPSPQLAADTSGRLPTGDRVAATPTPPPQHNPDTSVTDLAIPQITVDSAVVAVTPVAGSDGQAYWGVDATRLGLQTPGVGCGEAGNIVVNGHNWVTHGVLMALGSLHRDDQLTSLNRAAVKCTARNGSVYTYRIFAYGVFTADDTSFEQLLAGEQRDLTIYTCTNSGRGRIVIVARLEV
ncbi:MAG: hypothetical protein DLM69_03325, partial [Candidatus Chloroheliales bacterium]